MTTFREKTRRQPRPKRKGRALFRCGSCGKRYSNPLGHVCGKGGDFARRRKREKASGRRAREREVRAARRAKEADARRARRRREDDARRGRRSRETAATAARKRKAASRPARPAHPYESCRDRACERIPCTAWREGYEAGYEAGYAEGFEQGYGAGMAEGYTQGYAAAKAGCSCG